MYADTGAVELAYICIKEPRCHPTCPSGCVLQDRGVWLCVVVMPAEKLTGHVRCLAVHGNEELTGRIGMTGCVW